MKEDVFEEESSSSVSHQQGANMNRVMYATVDEILDGINTAQKNGKLEEFLARNTMIAERGQARGRGAEKLPAEVRIPMAGKVKALERYIQMVGQFLDPTTLKFVKEQFTKLSASNVGGPGRTARRPLHFGKGPEISITWRSSKPKDPKSGQWNPYVLVPLNLYLEKLDLQPPVKINDRYHSSNALNIKYEEKKITIACDKAITYAISDATESDLNDQMNEEENDEEFAEDQSQGEAAADVQEG